MGLALVGRPAYILTYIKRQFSISRGHRWPLWTGFTISKIFTVLVFNCVEEYEVLTVGVRVWINRRGMCYQDNAMKPVSISLNCNAYSLVNEKLNLLSARSMGQT